MKNIFRSSRPEVFCKKVFLRNFVKFTGKHPCQSLFFNKVAGLRPAILLKKRLWHRCFPVNFVKFLRIPFFTEQLRWLLLHLLTDFLCSYPTVWVELLKLTTVLKNTICIFVGNKAKGRISKQVFQERKGHQNFRKTNISYPKIRTRKCAFQEVRNVCFSEILACFSFLKHSF